MSTNCVITLPANTQVQDAASVMGILHGAAKSKHDIGPSHSGSWACEVDGVKIVAIPLMPQCCRIIIKTTTETNSYLWHFEFGGEGHRGTMPSATAYSIAMARRLVNFFGGSVDYNDCDDVDVDYEVPQRYLIMPDDGEEWQAFQQAMYDVEPLTLGEINDMKQYALQ